MAEIVMDSIDMVCMSIMAARSSKGKVGIAADPRLRRPGDTEALGRMIGRGHAIPLERCKLEHLRAEGRPELAEIELLLIQITKPGIHWFYAQQGKTVPGAARPQLPIGPNHEIVLEIVKQLGGTTYGLPVIKEVEKRGHDWSYGKMYVILSDLVERGYLDTWLEAAPPQDEKARGSKPRRWYRVVDTKGEAA